MDKIKKYIITFGSGQLPEINQIINPNDIMLVVEANSMGQAREQIFNSFIGDKFCTSYDYIPHAQEFKEKHNMFECTLENLITYVEAEKKRVEAEEGSSKAYYDLMENR